MEINFSMNVVAADAAKREITGRVVTWGEKGYMRVAIVSGNGICGIQMEPLYP